METSEVYGVLSGVFAEVFFRDDIVLSPSLSAPDVEGWDSYKQVEIILAVEEKFDIRLSSKEIDGLKCVGDLVQVIETKIAQK